MSPVPGHVRSRLLAIAALLFVMAAGLVAGTAHGGVIDPGLAKYLATLPPDAPVSVIIFFAEQAPLAVLDAQLRAEAATLQHRHEQVIRTLQTTADATQGPFLAELAGKQALGEVRGFTPYWIANLVVAEMTVRAVRELAARPEVGVVYSNFRVSLMEPVERTPKQDEPAQPAAVTPGVCAIKAPRVWNELGINGAGRLVCGLDTGVMGNHTALAARWRGAQPGVPWQHAWKDVLGTNTQFPTDTGGHGTHTMGTMVGLGAATQDSIGVAWGAQWIACNAINQGVGPAFDNDVIAAFQWIADPDGDPQTNYDVPDVVQNSWRVYAVHIPFGYNIPCDNRWWAVIDGCEAAGCAVVFSAGNEGPAPATIGSPPDRATTPLNAYAIGSVDAPSCQANPAVSSFSSRGPSGCSGGVATKPEVVAPGSNIRSSFNNGGYTNMSGTSMAGPHVSGIFPLLRQVNPDLDVTTMKQIIMDTARDIDLAGEDNNTGWGMVDAYEAVLAAMQTVGVAAGSSPAAGRGLRILAVNPNPLRPFALVSYELALRGHVAVRVYDLQGRLVRTLADGVIEPGAHSAFFDGRSDRGRDLASGTYFLRIEGGGEHAIEKLSVLR